VDGYSLEELLADLAEDEEIVDPGEDYLTPEQWAKRWGISLNNTRAVIRRALRQNKMERRHRQMERINGSTFPQPVYGFTKKEEQP
jgi:hypothetical protein